MKLISAIFLFQVTQARVKNLNELTDRISTDELLIIREKYCKSIETGKKSEFCSPVDDDSTEKPDLPPGFLLFILSLVKKRFQTSLTLIRESLKKSKARNRDLACFPDKIAKLTLNLHIYFLIS